MPNFLSKFYVLIKKLAKFSFTIHSFEKNLDIFKIILVTVFEESILA